MSLLDVFAPPWVLVGALVAAGLIYFAQVAAGPRREGGGGARFLLNLISLPLGLAALAATAARWGALSTIAVVIAVVVGAVLVGRSLREFPWTGFLALGAAALVAYAAYAFSPGFLSFLELLALGGIVFLITYVLLYLIEIPLRIAGFISVPRPILVALGLSSFAGAAIVSGAL